MFSNRNKDRLYIAYYTRGQAQSNDAPFHTALLLAPKNPSTKIGTEDTTRYHVINPLKGGRQLWQYDEKSAFARTDKLVAVMLLGKLPTSWNRQAVSELLRAVPVVQDNPQWRCRHWVWAAIDRLVAEGVLEGLAGNGSDVWNKGLTFARPHSYPDLLAPLPMCDSDGNSITSEFPAVS
ncbi:hypothetical protein GGX14DRAFT_499352 [Mycena pura]|uniref:Uncharacterized protein n=1 Tax=Mycena pura TaxID=153505 RepID=A0AAD6VCM2_9AGAR|nr:hypothetical protein GGX14DRAFT_499352 [Mycena pura]